MKKLLRNVITSIIVFSLLLSTTACSLFTIEIGSHSSSSSAPADIEYNYADVFIFMGQSNMAGRGNAAEAVPVSDGAAYEYRSVTGNDDEGWFYELKEPFGQKENNSAMSDGNGGDGKKTGGLVSAFAEAYHRESGVTLIGVSASVGNTSITEWVPGTAYFNESVKRLKDCVEEIESEGLFKIRHVNMVWCQGENDAAAVFKGALDYESKLKSIVAAMKKGGKASVEKCFVITISESGGNEAKVALANRQIELCAKDSDFSLASIKFRSVPDEMREDPHFKQGVYNVVGVDAGKRVAAVLYGKAVTECLPYERGEESVVAAEYGADLIYRSDGKAYFFSSSADDGGDGSEAAPFNNFDVIPDLDIEGQTGLLIKCGSVFRTPLLLENISGEEDGRVIVSTYGQGERPVIDGNGTTGSAVVTIRNCNHITVSGLDITDSDPTEGDKRGILIECYKSEDDESEEIAVFRDVLIKDNYVHHVKGILDALNNGMSQESKKTGGIYFWSRDYFSRLDGLVITGNVIENVDNVGIASRMLVPTPSPYAENFKDTAFSNVEISNNEIFDIGKNAIFLRNLYGGVVERNVVHDTSVRCYTGNQIVTSKVWGTVIQYNEGYNNMARENPLEGSTKKIMDGCMLDADLQSRDTLWQYNYSHDNSFGLFINCTGSSATDTASQDEATVRYNISVCDKGNKGVIYVNYYTKRLDIYNNTIIVDDTCTTVFLTNAGRGYNIFNNLVYDVSETKKPNVRFLSFTNGTFENNVIYSVTGEITGVAPLVDSCEMIMTFFDPSFKETYYGDLAYRTGYDKAKKFAALAKTSLCFEPDYAKEVEDVATDFLGNEYKPSIGCVRG